MMQPFQDESTVLTIDHLTIENRLDCIQIHGWTNISKDRKGLRLARDLKQIIDATVAALEKEELPEQISIAATETVDNPFHETKPGHQK